MKKTIIAMALLASVCTQMQAETASDTLVIEKADKVKIETSDTLQRIVISGAKDDSYFHYTQRISIPDTSAVRRKISNVKDFNKLTVKKGKGKDTGLEASLHLLLGMNTMTNVPDGYKFKIWPSFEIGINWMADWRPFGKRNIWSIGFGVDWRNYRMDKNTYLAKDANGNLYLKDYDADQSDRCSSLRTFSLQVPVLYTHRFSDEDGWAISVGGVINFNTGAHGEREFTIDDEDFSIDLNNIHQRPVTFDFMGKVKIPGFTSVYCKYSPNTYFKTDRGPKVHQISFGLYL